MTVTSAYDRGRREIAIAVIDTGIGIAEADRARIFEAFSQADSVSTPETGGTGLGLAICQRLAAVLGGRITLESKVRQGSTFTLIIPVGIEAAMTTKRGEATGATKARAAAPARDRSSSSWTTSRTTGPCTCCS